MIHISPARSSKGLTISPQIFNHAKARLAVSNSSVEVVLFTMLVHTEALKVDVPPRAELRLNRTRDVDGRLHGELLHAALHDGKVDRDHARHLNGAAERNLAVALREVQIADRELGTLDMDREVHLAAAREVLDVAVAAVLRAAGDGAGTLLADFLFDVVACGTGVHVLGLGRHRHVAVHVRACFDQTGFALVPGLEDFGRGRAA